MTWALPFTSAAHARGRSRRRAATLWAVALLLCLSCRGEPMNAVLVSGDAVTLVRPARGHELVVRKGRELARIRLVGIYTFDPSVVEKSDTTTWAHLAVDHVVELGRGQPLLVTLERAEPDRRGRFLAYVQIGAEDLGERLLREGYAALYTEFPFRREEIYQAAETPARAGVRGIWGGPYAVQRVTALRQTWRAARAREFGDQVVDSLLEEPVGSRR